MNTHAELFYCPYCGEQDLYPGEGEAWHCSTCLRSFIVALTAVGHLAPHDPQRRAEQP
jgi:hypothetical protein